MREFKLRTSQRPRPLPTGRWSMSQRWNDLLFAHWRLPAATISHFLPEGLQPDTFHGSGSDRDPALVHGSLQLPRPSLHSRRAQFPRAPFAHLRSRSSSPTPRVSLIFSVDIGSLLATAAVRFIYRTPCSWAEMRLNQRTEREFSFYSRRLFVGQPVIFNARYRGLGPTRRLAEIRSGSLEYFFTERYCLFTQNHAGSGGARKYPHGRFSTGRCRGGDRAQRSSRRPGDPARVTRQAGASLLAPPSGLRLACGTGRAGTPPGEDSCPGHSQPLIGSLETGQRFTNLLSGDPAPLLADVSRQESENQSKPRH